MRTIIIDMRDGFNAEQMRDDDRVAKAIGQAAVSGTVWNTEQEIGAHVLEKLTESGFIILKVLS